MKINKRFLPFLSLIPLFSINLVLDMNTTIENNYFNTAKIETNNSNNKVVNDEEPSSPATDFLDGTGIQGTIFYFIPDPNISNLTIISSSGLIGADLSFKSSISINGSSYNLTEIASSAFISNGNISGSLSFPNTITKIGANAFDNCTNLRGTLYIPSNLATIGNEAFIRTTFSAINVDPSNVNFHLTNSFSQNGEKNYVLIQSNSSTISSFNQIVDGLVIGDLYIPSGINDVSDSQKLKNCYSLKSANFADDNSNLTEMPSFYNDHQFNKIYIPKTITNINDACFQYTQVDNITINPSNENYQFATNLSASCTAVIPKNTDGTYVFKDETVVVPGLAYGFAVLPISLTKLADNAFSYCYNLYDATFFNCPNLKSIGENAFYMCYHFKSDSSLLYDLTFNSTLEKIGTNAFYGCPFITTVYLPESLKEIGDGAFKCNIDPYGNYVTWMNIKFQFAWTEQTINNFINGVSGYTIGKNVYPGMIITTDGIKYDSMYDNFHIYVNKQVYHYYLENKEKLGLYHIDENQNISYISDKNIHQGNIPNSDTTFINSLALGLALGIGIPVIIGTILGIYFYNLKKKRKVK